MPSIIFPPLSELVGLIIKSDFFGNLYVEVPNESDEGQTTTIVYLYPREDAE